MKIQLVIIYVILENFNFLVATDYRVIDFIEFDANEKYMILEYANVYDSYMFSLSARLVREIDGTLVRYI